VTKLIGYTQLTGIYEPAYISPGWAVYDWETMVYTTTVLMQYAVYNLWRFKIVWKACWPKLIPERFRRPYGGRAASYNQIPAVHTEIQQYQPRTKLMIIVPPVATAMKNRATRNPKNQGEKADNTPVAACSPMAKMRGILRPILQTIDRQRLLYRIRPSILISKCFTY
jgi:hypothetical protein